MGGVVAPVLGLFAAKKAVDAATPKQEAAQAQTPGAAAAPAADAKKQETGLDTTGASLKRKANGKKSLMIATNTTGGGSTGTGLNI